MSKQRYLGKLTKTAKLIAVFCNLLGINQRKRTQKEFRRLIQPVARTREQAVEFGKSKNRKATVEKKNDLLRAAVSFCKVFQQSEVDEMRGEANTSISNERGALQVRYNAVVVNP